MDNPSEIIAVIVSASATLAAAYSLKPYVDDKNKQGEESRKLYYSLVKHCENLKLIRPGKSYAPLLADLEVFVQNSTYAFFVSNALGDKVESCKDIIIKINAIIFSSGELSEEKKTNLQSLQKSLQNEVGLIKKLLQKEMNCFRNRMLIGIPAYLLTIAIFSHFIFSHYIDILTFFKNLICDCIY